MEARRLRRSGRLWQFTEKLTLTAVIVLLLVAIASSSAGTFAVSASVGRHGSRVRATASIKPRCAQSIAEQVQFQYSLLSMSKITWRNPMWTGLMLTVTLSASFVDLASPGSATAETGKVRVVGTYSNLKYNAKSGDLGGVEIKIVPARGRGFQGALQIAEGSPTELMIVDVVVEENKIRFRIPDSYPIYGGGTFQGVIEPTAIRGISRSERP